MSDIIRLLPDSVANQIAAGEVIQRPASVIKELVENAIDAGAQRVDVIITDAGKTSIQVVDDGKGMSETDARLSFERHATSKIKEAADLFALRTMGFRGEALASIAAVAQVELKTRTSSDELGTAIAISGSKVESQEVVSCPKGSNFLVKNLFFNVPARRKFLKSNQTELSNILAEFERIVLVNPSISFSLTHNDAPMFSLPKATLRQRLLDVFGRKLNQQLLSVEVETTLARVHGFVGKPEAARKKGAHQYFFVNGRYMRHPYFHRAVMDAYEHLIPAGEQVSYFIYFEVDPANIDVNIHPTKTEIKFENEQAIWQIVAAMVKESLGKFNAIPSIDFDTEGMPEMPLFDGTPHEVAPPKVDYNPNYNPFKTSDTPSYAQKRNNNRWEELYKGIEEPLSPEPEEEETPSAEWSEAPSRLNLQPEGSHMEMSSRHYQYKGRYILTSVKSGLMVIDQQRAHVRVLFDRYLTQMEKRQGASQGVLFPEVVQFPASEQVILESILDDLSAIGFDLSNLGGGSYAINGVPAGVEGLSPVDLLNNMVHTAMEKGNDVKRDVRSIIALSLAKSAAIVPGQVLSQEEMNSLVDSLFSSPTPNYTPDGKVVLSVIPEADIERLF